MADTLSANIAETTQELIDATIMLMPQKAPMINLVTRRDIPKGKNQLEIPRVNSTSAVQTPSEGDEIVNTSVFDLTSTTITPTYRAIKARIHERAQYFSKDQLVMLISEEIAQTQAQDIDTDLLAEFVNFGNGNDVGTTNVDLLLASLRTARRLLQAVPRASGGPAPDPIFGVLSPTALENVLTNIGLVGSVASTSPWIPAGLSEDLIKSYHVPNQQLVGVSLFWDGYITNDGSGDHICAMFSQKALWLAISKNWTIKTFENDTWPGVILRSTADYNSGVGAYPLWGSTVTADGD